MPAETNGPKSYFTQIAPDLPEELLPSAIENAAQSFFHNESGDDTLTEDDAAVLHRWARDARANVRKAAIEVLCWVGPVTWQDLDAWVFDADEGVRQTVLGEMDGPSTPLDQLLAADPPRYIHLLALATERYADFDSMWALTVLSANPLYLELVWSEINRLLELDRQDVRTTIQVQYLETVITERNWGAEDPHLAPWIQGNDQTRQLLLLITASWQGLESARYQDIVKALAQVEDALVAELAGEILAGTVRYSDSRGWFVWCKANQV